MYYPWQQKQWQQLWQAKLAQRLPHAVLLCGAEGTGKSHFAEMFAHALLCKKNNGASPQNDIFCQQCHSCRLISGRTHPNVMWVEPEKPGHAIKIDQVREVIEFIQQSALQGDTRIVLINPADDMNANAANALLKTLEEPTPGSLILLISAHQHRLPATIISRCQRLVFSIPERELAHQWVQSQLNDNNLDANLLISIAQGAPLKALSLADEKLLAMRATLFEILLKCNPDHSPIKLAEELQDIDLLTLINYLITWTTDLAYLKLNGEITINHDYQVSLHSLVKKISVDQCIGFMNFLQHLYRQLAEGINRNKQLLIESILIRWQMLFHEVQHVHS